MRDLNFYRGKRVFLTGHTGFKGAWLCRILCRLGAQVTGYALEPPTQPNLFSLLDLQKDLQSVTGDVRDYTSLKKTFDKARPQVVLHLAAQPLVRESYQNPRWTYETNVIGTVNLLECVRQASGVESVVNITTDKVYENREWDWGYRETDRLGGFDPYSNSKSCSELVTRCYIQSYLAAQGVPVSTVRAGNVIGGGDFAMDRIIPDCVRAAEKETPILVRNPHSIRPYQHVLEPLFVYLRLAMEQTYAPQKAGCYNVGPDERDCLTTGELAERFCRIWGGGARWEKQSEERFHEAGYLKLDCSLLKKVFGWRPQWDIQTALEKTVEWFRAYHTGLDASAVMDEQITLYMKELLTDGKN